MADGNDYLFNPELDKITERELVYDFASRVRLGKTFTDPDKTSQVIFSPPKLVKDILRQTVLALPKNIAYNLDKLHTAYVEVAVGANGVAIVLPNVQPKVYPTLILAISERTQTDYTSLFTRTEYSSNYTVSYELDLDVPFEACPDPNNELYNSSIADTIKFYYY